MAVASQVPRFFSSWERKNCLQSWANSQNDNYFHSKQQPRTILSENSCHFVNLPSFARSFFFLSLRKITRLNSQQPKTSGHVKNVGECELFKKGRLPPNDNVRFLLRFLLKLRFHEDKNNLENHEAQLSIVDKVPWKKELRSFR